MTRRFDRQFAVDDKLPYIADTGDAPVVLAALEVSVHITGLYAETTQILTLHNPNSRDLEGNLVFPLPDDAVVCGYAIDVDGALVDGVVVPKQEARRILEAEIRKGVDPGLVEQVRGNMYRTRIYPLPAGGTRTVKLVYVSALNVEGRDAAYHLPLGHAAGVDDVAVRVEVSQIPVEPALVGGLGNMTLAPFEQRWVAETRVKSAETSDDLQIRLPHLPDHLTMVEEFDGERYFCISSIPQRATAARAWDPARIALLWDSSGSRGDASKDIGLVEKLAATWRHVTVDVQVLRDSISEVHTFVIDDGDSSALTSFLADQPCDGGTNLAGVDLAVCPHSDDEAWLVFSDGLGTVGVGLPAGRSPRVFTISSQTGSDSALLRHLATRSGGGYFNLVSTSPEVAAAAICGWSDALRIDRAVGCEDVHVTHHSGRFTVYGRLTQEVASVRLAGPGAPTDQLSIARDAATIGRNLARAWAGQQAQLLGLMGVDDSQVVELGRRFGLVTPGTSLLVLETLDQYLEYDVEPPASLPHMREAFLAQRRQVQQQAHVVEQAQIERVVSMWNARVAWWETNFEYVPERQDEKAKGMAQGAVVPEPEGAPAPLRRSRMAESAVASAPPPAPGAIEDFDHYADEDEMMFDEIAESSMEMEELEAYPEDAPAKKEQAASAQASIQIQPWSADTPYIQSMRDAGPAQAYATYLQQRSSFERSPAFFLDCADHLLRLDQRDFGLRVLSNLLELALDDPPLLRMYAWRMQREGELDRAIEVFERVQTMRDDEPQSHRDLALALELRWQRDGRVEDATRAMQLLWDVIRRDWDRFPEIELIALMELNRLIHLGQQAGVEAPPSIDRRLIKLLDLDVRISMSWDADLTDVDLHVFEPTGEHAYYGHNQTQIGGLVSRDFTQGYGPEEYVLRRAFPGEYTIKTHYYGSHQQTLTGACTVIVNVFTNFGRPNEERQVLTLRLEQASDQVTVGTIRIDG